MRAKPDRIILVFVLCWISATLLIVLRLDDKIPMQHLGSLQFIHDDYEPVESESILDKVEKVINDSNLDLLKRNNILRQGIKKSSKKYQELAQDNVHIPQLNHQEKLDVNAVEQIENDANNRREPTDKPDGPNAFENVDGVMREEKNVTKDVQRHEDILLPPAIYDIQPPNATGEFGRGVAIDQNALSDEERKEFDRLMKLNAFNEYASRLISIRRRLRDIRNPSCPRSFNEELPSTSVIICFHNEAWTVLLRTVHSVLDRSPEHLVKEIILIDDYSSLDHLKEPLQHYMSKLGKIRILRTQKREGLIRARLLGVDHARAPVLTFLDSHVECFPGWLEPMLARVKDDRRRIVAPIINMISSHDFRVGGGDNLAVGMFKLTKLSFNWMTLPKRDMAQRKSAADPFRTPAIAGGLFSVNKDYFIEMGKYDEGMEIWGFENIEISLRIWMCGGSLEIHPCSHVAHIFRSVSPYQWGGNIPAILRKNAVRLAEVWLDDYKQFYYEQIAYRLGNYGNVTDRKELRKKLQCHSFQWYIDNVYPDMEIPPRNLFIGEVRQSGRVRCMDSMSFYANGNVILMKPCHGMRGNQMWHYTESNEFRIGEGCLTYSENKKKIVYQYCKNDQQSDNQKWTMQEGGRILYMKTKMCLERNIDDTLNLAECLNTESQTWEFKSLIPANAKSK